MRNHTEAVRTNCQNVVDAVQRNGVADGENLCEAGVVPHSDIGTAECG
jgi:hypothetical protein